MGFEFRVRAQRQGLDTMTVYGTFSASFELPTTPILVEVEGPG